VDGVPIDGHQSGRTSYCHRHGGALAPLL